MTPLIQNKIEEIKLICKNLSVSKLYLFGSALTNHFNKTSDIDLAVVFNENLSPLEHGEAYFELLENLENLLGRKIDLISYRVVKNPLFKEEIDRTKIALYAAA